MKNKLKYRFLKGYYRPISMPRWKWMAIYMLRLIAISGYILAICHSLWMASIGVIFQFFALHLTRRWDTGNWRFTRKGQEYIDRFGDN